MENQIAPARRVRLVFKLCRLPAEMWKLIFTHLTTSELQEASLVSKLFRHFIIRYPVQSTLNFPTEEQAKNVKEIELKMTRVLIINDYNDSRVWTRRVLNSLPNICTVKISDMKISKQTSARLFNQLATCGLIKKVVVPPNRYERWTKIKNNHRNGGITIIRNEENTLLRGVSENPIPFTALPFAESSDLLFSKFNALRNNSIQKLKNSAILNSPEEALSLNGIIMMAPDSEQHYDISSPIWNSLLRDFNDTYSIDVDVNDEDVVLCNDMVSRFSEACNTDLSNIEEHADNEMLNYNGQASIVKRTTHILHSLSRKVNQRWNANDMTEDTLTMNVFDPIISCYMGKVHPEAIYHGCDHELYESKIRKQLQNGPRACGRVPDRSIEITINDQSHHIYLAEIKTASKCRNRPDLVKIATMMKDCIDFALGKGYNRSGTHVVGLLQEGTKSTVFFLNSPSSHLYCFYQMSSFSLPSSIEEMDLLKEAVVGLEKCRTLVLKSANNLHSATTDHIEDAYDYRLTSTSPAHHAEYYS